MDVKKICWGLCLLACFSGFAGCSDDEDFSNENVIIREDFSSTDGEVIEISRPFGGVTYAVRHRKKNIVGVLIILNSAYLDKDRYSYLVNTISHESVHAADMVFQYIGQFTEDFDSKNEPYAYLVGWIAGCIGDYLTKYFKENGSEEV